MRGTWRSAVASRLALAVDISLPLAAVAGFLLLAPRCLGADARIVAARFGWGGCYRPGELCPVVVDLETRGGRFAGSLEVSVTTEGRQSITSTQPLDATGVTRQRRVLYAYPTIWLFGPRSAVTVRLKRGGQVVGQRTIPATDLHTLQFEDALLLVVSSDPYALNTVAGTPLPVPGRPQWQPRGEIHVANATASDLPDDVRGLASVRLVLLANAPLDGLTAAQARALSDWVLSGGTLVVAGGAEYGRLRSRVLSGLLPVVPTGVTVARRGSRAFGMSIPPATPVTAFRLAPNARIVRNSGGMAAVAPVGLGRCVFLAFDPTSAPLRALYQGRMWQALARLSASEERWRAFASGNLLASTAGAAPMVSLFDTVFEVGTVELPPAWAVVLYMCLYVITLGPANYGLIRSLRRPELGWFTVPATILVFTLGCYAAGYHMRGGALRLHRVTMVVAGNGAHRAPAVSCVGLLAPRQGRYSLQADWPAGIFLPAPYYMGGMTESDLAIDMSERPGVLNTRIDMWSTKGFIATTMADLGGGLSGSFSASPTSGAGYVLRGQLANRTGGWLSGCVAGFGDGVSSEFALPPGRTTMVIHVSSRIQAYDRSDNPFVNVRNTVLLQKLPGLTIVGALDRKWPPLFVNGKPAPCEEATLLVARIPCASPKGATP